MLENLYLVAQIVAGLAVIGSLLFIGFEVRRNTRAQLHQLGIERTSFFSQSNAWTIENEPLRKALIKGADSFDALTFEERLLFSAYHLHWIGAMIALWSQQEMIYVEPKYSEAFYQTFERFSQTPGAREWWAAVRLGTPPSFLDRFDALMKFDASAKGGDAHDARKPNGGEEVPNVD